MLSALEYGLVEPETRIGWPGRRHTETDERTMRRSVTSVFSDPDDFEAAMRAEGGVSLVITASGRFHARITQAGLNGVHLLDVNESIARVAFIKVPDDVILVALSLSRWPDWFWNGQEIRAGELVTLGPGETAHVRTSGAIHWCAVRLAYDEFTRLSRALVGTPIDVPRELCRWRSSSSTTRQLSGLHQFAIKVAQGRQAPSTVEAAHGLEQQVVQAVTECLATGSKRSPIAASLQQRDLMLRLEALVTDHLTTNMEVETLSAALGVSERLLRQRCSDMLGMGPHRYLRLRRMHAARLALRQMPTGRIRIAEVAQRFGFHNPGRFAGAYTSLFGEPPSATLRNGVPPVARRRVMRDSRSNNSINR